MASIGSASLAILPSFDGFQSKLEAGASKGLAAAGTSGGKKFGMAAGQSAGAGFGITFKKAIAGLGLAKLGVEAFQFTKASISSASDLNESLNAVNVTYGRQAKAVKKLGREAATSLGLSNNEFNGLSVRFSAFAKTIGGGGKGTVKTLDDLTTRASDFASVMNLDVGEAADLFQSGLAGETEPLRKYGLDLSAAKVEAFALSSGIIKNKDDLTEAAKVQARYGLLMQGTAKTQGDFKNTSDEMANSQRILSARWEDGKAKLGRGLLPIMTDATDFLLDKGIPAFEDFADWFTDKGIPAIKKFGGFVRDDVVPPLKKAGEFAGDLVGFLKDLPAPAKWAGLAAVLGGVGYTKLHGGALGGGGALGTVGKTLGLAKPVPVFVTNMGAGLPGGTPKPSGPLGKTASFASKAFWPAAIIASAGIGLNEFRKWNHGGDKNPVGGALSGGKVGDFMRDLFTSDDAKEYQKNIGVVNNAWAKVGKTTDGAREKVVLYDGTVRKVPTLWSTVFETPGLLREKLLVERYGSLLDGLDNRTITTFLRTIQLNKPGDPAEAGTPTGQPPNRSGPGGGVNVHIDRVEAHDYQDFMTQLDNRTRGRSLDGVP